MRDTDGSLTHEGRHSLIFTQFSPTHVTIAAHGTYSNIVGAVKVYIDAYALRYHIQIQGSAASLESLAGSPGNFTLALRPWTHNLLNYRPDAESTIFYFLNPKNETYDISESNMWNMFELESVLCS